MTWQLVLSTVVALLGATGGARIIDGILRKRAVKVEVADRVNDMTIEWAAAVKADAQEARKEAAEARREAAEARRAVRGLHEEIDQCAAMLRSIRTAILASDATLASLRALVRSTTDDDDHRGIRDDG